MTTFHFYELATGLFTGASFTGPAEHLQANTPEGCAALAGVEDWRAMRVVGSAVERLPASPPDVESAATSARMLRDRALADTDWLALRAVEIGEALPAEWRAYRQALRDLPQQAGFPLDIAWPLAPAGQ